MAIFNGGAGGDNLRGGNGADILFGGAGDDTLIGGGGSDLLFGGTGRDTLDGGSGSDVLDGGLGDDLLIYRAAENRGAYDVYNGGFGTDTLRIVLTAAEWDQAAIRQDVHRFLAYLPGYNEPLGWITNPLFLFNSLGLAVVGVNKLEVVVDGRVVDATDRQVALAADAVATTENAGVTVDVLAGDRIPDGVRSVSVTQPAKGIVELVSTDFAAANPSAVFRFVPGTAFDALAQGETAVQVFTYTVTDKDGDAKTSTVQVTITGTNDAPIAVADAATHVDGSGEILTGSVATNDVDVDGAPGQAYYDYNYYEAPRGFSMAPDGSWSFDEAYQSRPGELREGENVVYEIGYTVTDAFGATSRGTLTFTVKGVNDAPDVYAVDTEVPADAEADEDGVISQYLNISLYDRDSPNITVTVLSGPDDPIGELRNFGYYDGQVTFFYDVKAALVAGLAEGETLVQNYRVRLDDGDGGVVEMDFPVTIVGDGEDPTVFLDVESPEYDHADGFQTVEFDFDFEDYDVAEEIRFEVRPVGDAIGTWTIIPDGQNDERRYIRVVFSYSNVEIDALPDDRAEVAYQIVAIDAAGNELIVDHVVQPRYDMFYVGGDGNDDIDVYSSGNGIGIGGEGDDRLTGHYGRDFLYGDEGPEVPAHEEPDFYNYEWADPVSGFNDELDGGEGADTLHGGAGADRFVFWAGEADGDVVLDFDPASGDVLEFHDYGQGATLRALGEGRYAIVDPKGVVIETITLANGAVLGADDYRFLERPVAWSIGSETNDNLYGSSENPNVLVGNGGSDELIGRDFADELYGDEGPELPDGVVNQYSGFGGRWFGEYDDELNGGGGADLLVGGGGNDRFVFERGEADGDVVRDFDGADGDRLDLTAWGYDATFTRLDATRWRIADADGDDAAVITLANGVDLTDDDVLMLRRDTVWWVGGDGDDLLSTPGGQDAYVLVGGAGRDFLYGDSQNDKLYGDRGPELPADEPNGFDGTPNFPENGFDDDLLGYDGDDLLNGGAGGDRLNGGRGADSFVFAAGEADGDLVQDFDGMEGDRLDFTGFGIGATFTRIDDTRWEIATADRSSIEVITFENAPVITDDHILLL